MYMYIKREKERKSIFVRVGERVVCTCISGARESMCARVSKRYSVCVSEVYICVYTLYTHTERQQSRETKMPPHILGKILKLTPPNGTDVQSRTRRKYRMEEATCTTRTVRQHIP